MISLAVLLPRPDAPFLGVVQVVVYTGAVMMLFLFVLMLVGVDSARLAGRDAARASGSPAVLAGARLRRAARRRRSATPSSTDADGLERRPTPDGNVEGIAALIFTRYVFAFEVTGALLITAALGAMVLTHRERLERRARPSASCPRSGSAPAQHPPAARPGVYARHNAVDIPALLPDGTPAELSVSTRRCAPRGVERTCRAAEAARRPSVRGRRRRGRRRPERGTGEEERR